MIMKTYSQMCRSDKYSQLSSLIWSVWPNGWVVVYELSSSAFESRCSHLNARYRASKEFRDIPANIECGFTLKCVYWQDKNLQSNTAYRYVLTTQLNHLVSLEKWLSVPLQTQVLLGLSPVAVTQTSDIAFLWSKEFLDIQANIKCGFTLKRVHDMVYSQMHPTNKYSKLSSINSSVWPNGWVFVYELTCCGYEYRCSHLNFRYRDSFEQGVS